MEFVEAAVEEHQLAAVDTLEIGSRNINGSPRCFFTGSYVGLDMIDGPDVDVVGFAAALPFADASFDCVVCTEMLEHDPTPWLTLPEIARVLRPGGVVILTARGIGYPLHGFPDDYWRFTASSFRHLFELAGLRVVETRLDDPVKPGVLGVAYKSLTAVVCEPARLPVVASAA
jgi:SAM-dependent methyltransferase